MGAEFGEVGCERDVAQDRFDLFPEVEDGNKVGGGFGPLAMGAVGGVYFFSGAFADIWNGEKGG